LLLLGKRIRFFLPLVWALGVSLHSEEKSKLGKYFLLVTSFAVLEQEDPQMTITAKVAIAAAVSLFFVGSVRVVQAAPPTDACSLLTSAEVSAALGVSVGAGQKIVPNSAAICGWEVPGEKSTNRKRIVLSIYTQMGRRTPIDRFNAAKTPVQGITKEPVSGVGDDAIFATTPGLGSGLIFRKGDAAFDLRVYGFPEGQLKAKAKILAQDVLARL
jgi:hypothetical protein